MNKDPKGNPAPPGGFQNGGWYSGYQYWGGTFAPQAGMIHPNSNQQGAGQAVSKEVNDQTNPNNQAYIDKLNSQPVQNPQAPVTPVSPSSPSGVGIGTGAGVGSGTGTGAGMPQAPTIDLAGLYKKFYDESGLSDLETTLSQKEKAYNERISKINDNPYLSEATRTGRLSKLEKDYQNDIASSKNDLAVKKADIETKLNIQMKQFDINSQAAQQAMQQFNSLLSMGALNNASSDTIANLVRSTGLSSDMIISAINKQKQGEIKPQVIQNTDDNGNVTVTIIDANTGNTISQKSLGVVDKSSKTGVGGMTATQTRATVGEARTVLQNIDEGYQTINGKLVNLKEQQKSDPTVILQGDKRLSAQEYIEAVNELMRQTGIDQATADNLLAQAMKDMGYSRWKW